MISDTAVLALSYLLGAVPFGWLLGKAHGVDIRKLGSGNIGATNLGRTLGRGWGVAAFLLDFAKGAVPVLVASRLAGGLEGGLSGDWIPVAAGAVAVAGHVWPVYLGFHGGKGVATAAGVFAALHPVATVAAGLVWLLILGVFRYVSLASVAAALVLPVVVFVTASRTATLVLACGLALLVLVRHRANLARIRAGTEPRVGKKK